MTALAAQLRDFVDLQRRQRTDDLCQQVVGQLRVAGQTWAVQIRRHHAALHRAVKAVPRPVARAADHFREWLDRRPENGSAAVVFEAGEPLRESREQRLGHHLADRPLLLRRRRHVQQANPVDALTG